MTVRRERKRTQTDARYVAEATLSTGKVLRRVTDWKPAHWDCEDGRRSAVRWLKTDLVGLGEKYGLTSDGPVRVYRETRTTETWTEVRTRRKFDSEHTVGGATDG